MEEEKMTKIFIYGMLQSPEIIKGLISRVPDMAIAHLKDFGLYNIFGNDFDVPNLIVKAIRVEGLYLNGRIIEVNDEELSILDNFEGHTYKRTKVMLYGNIECEIYC